MGIKSTLLSIYRPSGATRRVG